MQSTNPIYDLPASATAAIGQEPAEDADELPQRQSLLDHRTQQVFLAMILRLMFWCGGLTSIGFCH
jgi:hypothetical protein